MKRLVIIAALAFSMTSLSAQEKVSRAELETRIDYMQEYIGDDVIGPGSGFKGRYLLFRLDGNLSERFSYSFRQRINRPTINMSLFDATDWLNLTYTAGAWSFSAGKQIVAIGGYEYDRSPVNLFFCSEYWNNIACFQFGVSGSYTFSEKKDMLTFQISESPFRRGSLNPENNNIFAYNLMWNGSHEWFKSIYSVNALEYMQGRFLYHINLGNRFEFGKFVGELDLVSRFTAEGHAFLSDYSVIGELSYSPVDALNVFVKASYDCNKGVAEDLFVAQGTDIYRVGAGVEYFPLKGSRNLRLHLNCCYSDGHAPATNVLSPRQTILDAGLTWKINFLNIKRRS